MAVHNASPVRLAPFRLAPWYSPRPWGLRNLLPWYDRVVADGEEPIGEAWLTGPNCVVETGPFRGQTLQQVAKENTAALLGSFATQAAPNDFPLLMKIIFTSDKLSVQVHPDDALAQENGHPRGKTECWYFLDAKPGASIALGLQPGTTEESIRSAIVDNSLEQLLHNVPVKSGDMVFVEAGTVHAIGPGVVVLETQQQSDLTYRMYDYGRERELHIDLALRATRLRTAAGKVRPRQLESHGGLHSRLIDQVYFTVDRYDIRAGESMMLDPADVPRTLVGLAGDAAVRPAGGTKNQSLHLTAAQAVVLPPSKKGFELLALENAVAVCSTPQLARQKIR